MAMGNIDTLIMITMRGIGRMISNQGMESIPSLMAHGMKANLKMEGLTGKVRWFRRPRGMIRLLNMLGIGRIVSLMGKVRPFIRMGIIMRELSIKDSVAAMESSLSIRLIGMKENGKMGFFTVTGNFIDRGSYSLREDLKMD